MSESSGGFTVKVAGRTVVVRTGTKSQTINICTSANVAGTYEATYRVDLVNALTDPSDLALRASLGDLADWLTGTHNARPEIPSGRAEPVASVPADASDPWVTAAVAVVDKAIDALVTEFLERPYRHRVEHSLHTELVAALMADPEIGQVRRLQDGTETQLVHKEWPETSVRTNRGRTVERRGLFDIVVLAPNQLGSATLDHFKPGRIVAPIVVELGLDYGRAHLETDLEKFNNSAVPFGRLVHLSRRASGRGQVETIVNDVGPGADNLRLAYGHHDGSGRAVKFLADPVVRPLE